MKSDVVPSVLVALQHATHVTLHQLATRLDDLGLTASELNALAVLADRRERTVSELGAAVGVRPTTLTSVLDRLQRRGHIERGSRAGDRRSVLIRLTDSGKQAAAKVRRATRDLERKALRGLPAEDVEGFHAVLRALTKESP